MCCHLGKIHEVEGASVGATSYEVLACLNVAQPIVPTQVVCSREFDPCLQPAAKMAKADCSAQAVEN